MPKPLEKITRSDISREMPSVGETEIVMQRHEKYIRDVEHERSGSLEREDAKKAYEQTVEILTNKFEDLSGDERKNVDILVIASNTDYGKAKGMRSFETASEVVKGVLDVFKKYDLNKNQLLNSRTGVSEKNDSPVPTKNKAIQEPRFINQSPEFFEYLKSKYGSLTQQFWQAFEEDWEKDERKKLGAEGPEDILMRYNKFIETLKNFSDYYHKKHSGKRLIIWPVSHYDTISPYTKNKVAEMNSNNYLAVDYGAGISLNINCKGKVSSKIQGREYEIT
ncbi:MAG: hypothetical protein WC682_04395 [Parcubacteria group bacterium]|jgi:hypothetical protein